MDAASEGECGPYLRVSAGLTEASVLAPGKQRLDLGLVARPDWLAARATYLGRWSPQWSAFAETWAGAQRAAGVWNPDFGAVVGLRGEW